MKINMGESSSLSSGIVKLDGKAEYSDGKEQVYINISKAKGYRRVRKMLNGERRTESVSATAAPASSHTPRAKKG